MAKGIELDLLNNLETVKGEKFFSSHFEAPLVSGESRYKGLGQYTQYLGDHHICELYMGTSAKNGPGIKNWREYAGRMGRFNEAGGGGGSVLNEVFLIYEDDFTLGMKHSYRRMGDTALFQGLGKEGKIGQIANILGQGLATYKADGSSGIKIPTTSDVMLTPSRFLETQFYEATGPWTFNTTFTFRFGQYGLWDCYEEVFKPAMALLAMGAPSLLSGNLLGNALMEAPGPTQYGLVMSMGQGILRALVDEEEGKDVKGFVKSILENFDTLGDKLAAELSEREKATEFLKSLTVAIGQTYEETKIEAGSSLGSTANKTRNLFVFRPCILKGVTASFSKYKDMSGYPIKATVALEIETQLPAVAQNLSSINTKSEWDKRKRPDSNGEAISISYRIRENNSNLSRTKSAENNTNQEGVNK
jgi:hypothetical protein